MDGSLRALLHCRCCFKCGSKFSLPFNELKQMWNFDLGANKVYDWVPIFGQHFFIITERFIDILLLSDYWNYIIQLHTAFSLKRLTVKTIRK
jgi:hypothetical protein